ncbi:MAG: hypothetical protein M1594_00580 [Candidatus Marsarchaeota archaeon]|nr:hypothetical protein [Candidatus Marsarchaeota archaeon]
MKEKKKLRKAIFYLNIAIFVLFVLLLAFNFIENGTTNFVILGSVFSSVSLYFFYELS